MDRAGRPRAFAGEDAVEVLRQLPLALTVVGGDASTLARALGVGEARSLVDRSREDAEEANRLLTTLLDAVPDPMAFFDRHARLVRVNAALADVAGGAPDDYVGGSLADMVEADVAIEPLVAEVFATGGGCRDVLVKVSPRSNPSRTLLWTMSVFPIRLRGQIAWVGATVVDVTEWHRAERERAQLLEAEKEARSRAEMAAERLARLQLITARLAEATSMELVAGAVVRNGAAAVGATMGALLLATPDGRYLETVEASGFDPEATALYRRVAVADALPVAEAARTGEIVFIASRDDRDERWPQLAAVVPRSEASTAIPLWADDRLLGAITLGWPSRRRMTQEDREFLLALGRQCSLALERVRLYEAERRARALAEQATERMAFLAEASRVLASSLEYEETLGRLAELAVREIADVCVIYLADGDDVRLVGAAHRDPSRLEALGAASSVITPNPKFLGLVFATGEPAVVEDWSTAFVERISQNPRHEHDIGALGIRSGIAVPLLQGGRPIGVLALGRTSDAGGYRAVDLDFVQDIAARVSVAVENSLAHRALSEVARTLQQSLLPPVRPAIPGLELATRYHSAGVLDVGGDFFDVFPSGDGRWGVVMGDVCGRGAGAATLTSLARHTVRAGTIDEGAPAQVLRLLNRAILETEVSERFCTIVHLVVRPGDDGAQITLACGGHPLPLLVRRDGEVSEVGRPGTAIGLFEEIDITEAEVWLGPGDAIVLYTDGFTEARDPDGRFAPGLLEAALAGAAGGGAEQLADAVDRAVLAFGGGRPRDDMALLIARVPSARTG